VPPKSTAASTPAAPDRTAGAASSLYIDGAWAPAASGGTFEATNPAVGAVIGLLSEGGRVDVRAIPTDGGVEISVTDTGIGIAPENQELIFEEFRQVGGDYAHKREGTGLGLTLARKFVELHGGRLWVKSQLGQGSTFTFSVPERPWPAS